MNFISRLHKSFSTERTPLILTLIFFILFRFLLLEEDYRTELWCSMLIQIGIAFFLLYLNQAFIMIRQRSLLPAFFYLLLVGTNPHFSYEIVGSLSALIICFCFYFLFSSYQDPHSQRRTLNIGILISFMSLFWFHILILLALFWYGMLRFRSFNTKTFFASITGILVVYLFLFSWSVYNENISLFTEKFSNSIELLTFQLSTPDLTDLLIIGILVVLLILSGINIFMAGISEKVRTITTLSYLYIFGIVVLILSLIDYQWENRWILILYIPLSYLFAHYFTLTTKKWASWLFIFIILFFICMYFIELHRVKV